MTNSSQTLSSADMIACKSLLVFFLNNATSKLPIKGTDVTEGTQLQSKALQKFLPTITQALKNNYGIILKELPGRKFICFAENANKSLNELNEEQQKHTTLLFIILSYIFMSGGVVYEEKLQNFLRGLKIYYDEEHDYFGPNIKKLISETFTKQLYLKKEKSQSELDVDVRYVFKWGLRANEEFNKYELLKATAKLMGKDADFFQAQYEEALKDEADTDVTLVE